MNVSLCYVDLKCVVIKSCTLAAAGFEFGLSCLDVHLKRGH